jgi:hypothetical protein
MQRFSSTALHGVCCISGEWQQIKARALKSITSRGNVLHSFPGLRHVHCFESFDAVLLRFLVPVWLMEWDKMELVKYEAVSEDVAPNWFPQIGAHYRCVRQKCAG